MKNKNVLVTGGNGMIGQALVELLYDTTPDNIMVADLPNVDLRDRKDCKAVCEGQDIVFHLAGIKGSPQRCMKAPASFSVPMIQFNANMIEAAYNADVEWFLYTSSVGVYHPTEVFVEDDVWKTFPSENDWYAGWAKRIGEMNVQSYMKEHNWNKCSIVRPANVYGPNDNFGEWSMVVPSLIKKACENDDAICSYALEFDDDTGVVSFEGEWDKENDEDIDGSRPDILDVEERIKAFAEFFDVEWEEDSKIVDNGDGDDYEITF